VTESLRVVQPGLLSTVQDLGRPGWFASGVGVSGAADPDSLRLANRLVGNPEAHAALECLLGGLVLEVLRPLTVALAGACSPIVVDERPMGHACVIRVGAGSRIRLGQAAAGMRSYLAIRGGIAVEPVLGSRSRDTLAGIGPEPLQPGDLLPVGPAPAQWPVLDQAPIAPITGEPLNIRVVLGPRDDWFVDPEVLLSGEWAITDATDRVGARLTRSDEAPPLRRRHRTELATEGMALGAIQVPPSGDPVVFLADHPITGGYPVIAVVRSADVRRVAQARPGQRIRFRA
jgi:biotin-dependent carboxylase-like uncharacterized protein